MNTVEHNWRYEKILTLSEAEKKAEELRGAGKTIVTTNGACDILHAGHLDALEEAKQQGDVLIVGMNSDASVKDGKGDSRPYIGEQERAALLAALVCVDYVVVLDVVPYGEAQDVLLRSVKPNIHVNNSEYGKVEDWVEWPVMQEVGAKGYTVERREGLATSDIVKKIKEL